MASGNGQCHGEDGIHGDGFMRVSMMIFLEGDPSKPSFSSVTGRGIHPMYK